MGEVPDFKHLEMEMQHSAQMEWCHHDNQFLVKVSLSNQDPSPTPTVRPQSAKALLAFTQHTGTQQQSQLGVELSQCHSVMHGRCWCCMGEAGIGVT